MRLRVYPDPILTEVSEPVTEFDGLDTFCDEMYEVMVESGGAGISAVQVGVLKRIVIVEVHKDTRHVFINPKIIEHLDESFSFSEGCLSVPGYFEERKRHNTIVVRYQDTKGETHDRVFHGLEAFCIQHELDHLEGKLFIDDLSPLKKDRIRKKIDKTLRRK